MGGGRTMRPWLPWHAQRPDIRAVRGPLLRRPCGGQRRVMDAVIEFDPGLSHKASQRFVDAAAHSGFLFQDVRGLCFTPLPSFAGHLLCEPLPRLPNLMRIRHQSPSACYEPAAECPQVLEDRLTSRLSWLA